ncbi:MAG: hypothetical protein Tsb002_26970 [Wenzhouxiangellaceae bacterium]
MWYHLARKGSAAIYAHPEEHFKYGGIGLKQGFPYYLWAVMPEVFADLLPRPGGWEVFGLIDEGRGYPVGFALQTVGYPGLTPNCALCHTGQYRTAADQETKVVPGAPAASLDFYAFNQFVFAAANDPRFTSETLMAAIEQRFDLTNSEALIYRYILLPTVKNQLQQQHRQAAWMQQRPVPGHGRFDAFNLFKIGVLGLPDDGSIGTSDYPPLWNQATRAGQYLHWNGSGNNIEQDDLMSVYPLNQGADGFLPASFAKVTSYLQHLQPPPYPFPIDPVLAANGSAIYSQHCARCHAFGGAETGQVTAQSVVGTDAEFLTMWSDDFVKALKAIDSPPFQFPGLRITDGYLNVPLDGVWLRAPYLHNGSVPTLSALLSPPAQRPAVFYRGNPVYDPATVGFEATSADNSVSRYDTQLKGNANSGHDYGVDLPATDKQALIEFLKTL